MTTETLSSILSSFLSPFLVQSAPTAPTPTQLTLLSLSILSAWLIFLILLLYSNKTRKTQLFCRYVLCEIESKFELLQNERERGNEDLSGRGREKGRKQLQLILFFLSFFPLNTSPSAKPCPTRARHTSGPTEECR